MADGTAATPAGRDGIVAKLQELGMTGAGAQQLLDAKAIVAPDDRRILAALVSQLLASPAAGLSGDILAASTEPGTSKVSTRIIAENFD